MAGVGAFDIFGEEVLMNHGEEVPKVVEVQPAPQPNGAAPRLNQTTVMSAFVLTKFSDLIAQGAKTDKGFKESHVNAVAKELQAFIGQPVTYTLVYNHLRKWCAKWVKVCKLKDLSGANQDEDLCMITLAPEHYAGRVKVLTETEPYLFANYF